MKQRYHIIIKLHESGMYMGWAEELPGAMTYGRSLQLLIDTHRDEARRALDPTCIQESIEIDLLEPAPELEYQAAHA